MNNLLHQNDESFTRANEALSQMQCVIGSAIDIFGRLETALELVFCELMHPADPVLCAATFQETLHVDTRTRIIKAVAEIKLANEQRVLEHANKTLLAVDRRRRFRNKLAHGQCIYWKTRVGIIEKPRNKDWSSLVSVRLARPPSLLSSHIDHRPLDVDTLSVKQIMDQGRNLESVLAKLVGLSLMLSEINSRD